MRGLSFFLLAAVLLSLPVAARSQIIQFSGIDGMTQNVKQEGQSAISGLAMRVRIGSDDLPVGMSIMPTIEYWKDSDQIGDFNIKSSQKDLSVGVDLRYDLSMGAWKPYLGAGVASHFITSKFEAPDIGVAELEEGHTKVGPNMLLGLQLAPLGFLQSFIEAKYSYVPPYRQFKLDWGFGVNF